MNDQRKRAYRSLLYYALIDIRLVYWAAEAEPPTKGPSQSQLAASRIQRVGVIADWLHNLASFSANDFDGFDEEYFWDEHQRFCDRYPMFRMEHYRERFEQDAGPRGV
ncbi:MAG: hypothetical protein FJ304_05720 [Planctomycetes bacterium]|nr:hypothetical protein [Planctomycetota bacterium]